MPALKSLGSVSPTVIRYPLVGEKCDGVQETFTIFIPACLTMMLVGGPAYVKPVTPLSYI